MEGLFDSLSVTLLITGIVLLISALVVRDQTEFRVSRLRSELLGLRNDEKRLSERRDEIELMVAQIGDALMRAERRSASIATASEKMTKVLETLGATASGSDADA